MHETSFQLISLVTIMKVVNLNIVPAHFIVWQRFISRILRSYSCLQWIFLHLREYQLKEYYNSEEHYFQMSIHYLTDTLRGRPNYDWKHFKGKCMIKYIVRWCRTINLVRVWYKHQFKRKKIINETGENLVMKLNLIGILL